MSALQELSGLKGVFTAAAGRRAAELLKHLDGQPFDIEADLIHLHETVLFLRAYPQSPSVLRWAEQLLSNFAERLRNVDLNLFDDPEISGMAATEVSSNFSFEIVQGLVSRCRTSHRSAIQIDWDNYEHPERLGSALARLAPLASELWTVEPHVNWRAWFESAKATLPWLLKHLDPHTYDLLEIPIRWSLGTSPASRTLARLPHSSVFYHSGPLLKRNDVSLEGEFGAPPVKDVRVAAKAARPLLERIADLSAARYRELWGFTHPDAGHVYHAHLGRGVDLYFFGLPKQWRLPLRAYHCGMFAKNGVPMGYVETLSLFEHAEVGFNLYYTFREGETAWLYARILKVIHEHLGVTCFSIDPYQIGADNEEAIASGAFWFYRKLGFGSASGAVQRLTRREEEKLASQPGYRTPASMLRRMSTASLIYDLKANSSASTEWGRFSLERLCQRVGRGLPPGFDRPELARAKAAPEEIHYLRVLQTRPDLRSRVLQLGSERQRTEALVP